ASLHRENRAAFPNWEFLVAEESNNRKGRKVRKEILNEQKAFRSINRFCLRGPFFNVLLHQCFSLRTLRSLRLIRFAFFCRTHEAQCVSTAKRHRRPDRNPPGPGHSRELPEINLGAESKKHSDHRARFRCASCEHAE